MIRLNEDIHGKIDDNSYLTFELSGEKFALDILSVQEIMSINDSLMSIIKKIMGAPSHVLGLINLHEKIVPVVDLRLYYGLDNVVRHFNVIIFIKLHANTIGIVVDSIPDIVKIKPSEIKKAAKEMTFVSENYIDGVGVIDEKLVPILDIEALLLSEHMKIYDHLKYKGSYEN